jgi:hypothetical protein
LTRRGTKRCVAALILIGAAGCRAPSSTAPEITQPAALAATATVAIAKATVLPPGVLWVDPTQVLGEISKYVLGVNHGPWSDLGSGNIKPAAESGITFLRWPGGSWGDHNDIRPSYVDNYIAVARNIMAAEPSITVRMAGSTPAQAAQLVTYVNSGKKYGVRYWSIGNEPSLYYQEFADWTPARYASEWRAFALAMRAIDPAIILTGPDIHQFVGDPVVASHEGQTREYLSEFLKTNADLVDIVTVHRYPFPVDFRCQTCPYPSKADLRDNTPEWDRILPNLHKFIRVTTGADKRVGITEFNSHTTNAAGGKTTPDSFYNAIWLADVLARLIQQRPEIITYWMLKSRTAGHGLMDSYNLRPSYYVYQMYRRFGNQLVFSFSPAQYVSLLAAKRQDGGLTLMLINRGEPPVSMPLQIRGGESLQLTQAYLFDAAHNAEEVALPAFQNGDVVDLPPESVMLLQLK